MLLHIYGSNADTVVLKIEHKCTIVLFSLYLFVVLILFSVYFSLKIKTRKNDFTKDRTDKKAKILKCAV